AYEKFCLELERKR
ncbi:hypothetical protein CapIbe_009609, partial [Capra ibex]